MSKTIEAKNGSIVMLKSGGCLMTVMTIRQDIAICCWINEAGDFQSAHIPIHSLKVKNEEEV